VIQTQNAQSRTTASDREQIYKGWIVTVSGRLVRDDGVVALTATSKSLVYWPDSMRL
jgi:hypothetical protein